MIAWPAKTRIWIAAGVTDLRRGFTGLSAQVQTKLEQSPFSGHVFDYSNRVWLTLPSNRLLKNYS